MAATATLAPVGFRLPSEGVRRLVRSLDAYGHAISLPDLIQELQQCHLFADDMGWHAIYREDRYARNLIRISPFYELYCMCWRSGQCSPIHNHGNSLCAVRVLQGILTNIDFASTRPGFASPWQSTTLAMGDAHGSADGDIHQICNLEPAEDLMTLHIYSPPLRHMKTFQKA